MPARKTDMQVLADHSEKLPNGCVRWTGKTDKDGYPKTRRNSPRFGMVYLAHRLAYLIAHGSITEGLEIDHVCRNPTCVNPDHLEAVTHAVNVSRSVINKENHRNARKTICKNGHPLSGENLIIERWQGLTMRKCRTCRTERIKKRNAKMKTLRTCAGCGGGLCERSKICRTCYLNGFREVA